MCVYFFFWATSLPASLELSKPLSLAFKLLTKATAVQGSEEKACMCSREEKAFVERGAGEQRSFSPLTGKAHHYGGPVPSEWGTQEFPGSSLTAVSLPPFQE